MRLAKLRYDRPTDKLSAIGIKSEKLHYRVNPFWSGFFFLFASERDESQPIDLLFASLCRRKLGGFADGWMDGWGEAEKWSVKMRFCMRNTHSLRLLLYETHAVCRGKGPL